MFVEIQLKNNGHSACTKNRFYYKYIQVCEENLNKQMGLKIYRSSSKFNILKFNKLMSLILILFY